MARATNDAGISVGQSFPDGSDAPSAAIRWDAQGQPRRLQDLVAEAGGVTLVSAVGVNNTGTIAALGFLGEALHAVLLTPVQRPPKRHARPAHQPKGTALAALVAQWQTLLGE